MSYRSWQSKTVGELVTFSGGSQPPKSAFSSKPEEGHVRLIQIRDYKTNEYETYIPRRLARKFCSVTDVMIGRYGPPIFQILRGLEGAYNVALMKAIPNEELTNDYLYYFLQQKPLFLLIDRLSRRSAGQAGVDLDALREYEFPLPDIAEQNAITEALDTWNAALETVQQLLAMKRERKRGLMHGLLSGKKRFRGFEGERWPTLFLGDVITFEKRIVTKPKGAFLAAGIRSHGKGVFLKPDFEGKDIALDELFQLRTDDLVVNITFAWEGAVAIVPPEADGALVSHRFPTFTFNQDVSSPDYFRHVIRQKRFIHEMGSASPGGAGRNRVLSKNTFLQIPVELPSLEEQGRIAAVLNGCDREIELLQTQLTALKEQKRGLMQRLLTGELRFKVPKEN